MRKDEPSVARLLEVAASTVPLLERARGLVEVLHRWVPSDAIWMTLADLDSNVYATIGSRGRPPDAPDGQGCNPAASRGCRVEHDDRPRVRVYELPAPADVGPGWTDGLVPAGPRDGLSLPLLEADGTCLGMLSFLFSDTDRPDRATRDRITGLVPVVAREVSPIRSLLAGQPGIVHLARSALLDGQVYRTFMWPAGEGLQAARHVRVTVIAATDVPRFVLGTVLVTDDAHCHGLTTRELEVLGLMVDGRSNQQIAQHLVIAVRTVATHVEHILRKLEVPTRTLAAVRAEREGCYVPAPPRRR